MRRDLQEEPESTIGSKPQHEEPQPEQTQPEQTYKARWQEEQEAVWSPETQPPAPPPDELLRK